MKQPGVVTYGKDHVGFRPTQPGNAAGHPGYLTGEDTANEAWADESFLAAPEARPVVVVTRHAAVVEWLCSRGFPVYDTAVDDNDNPLPNWEIISHVTDPAQVAGKIVIGALPMHLAAAAYAVGVIDMPGLRPDQRGKELSLAEMVEAGATLNWYRAASIEQPLLR